MFHPGDTHCWQVPRKEVKKNKSYPMHDSPWVGSLLINAHLQNVQELVYLPRDVSPKPVPEPVSVRPCIVGTAANVNNTYIQLCSVELNTELHYRENLIHWDCFQNKLTFVVTSLRRAWTALPAANPWLKSQCLWKSLPINGKII